MEQTFDADTCIGAAIDAAQSGDVQIATAWALISIAISASVRSGALENQVTLLAKRFFDEPDDETFAAIQSLLTMIED